MGAGEGGGGARLVVGMLRVGDVEAAHDCAPALHVAAQHVHVAEEAHDEGARRLLEDLARAAHLLDVPAVHDGDPIGHLEGLLLVVGDEHAGHVDLVVQATEPLAQLLAHLGVERAERLVEEEHLRLRGQRARQRDALALPARELRGEGALQPLELDQGEELLHALVRAGPWPAAHAEPEGDVVEHAHVPEERVVLEDEADVALADADVGDVLVVVAHGAAVGDLESRDDPEQRGLAGARGPEQGEERPARHLEAHVVERQELVEALGDPDDPDAHPLRVPPHPSG